MSISVPAVRLTPSNPGGPGLSGWRDPPHGFGVAPGARAETGSPVCQVKTFRAHSVPVQIAVNWAERQGDRGRLHRLLRHAEALERDLLFLSSSSGKPRSGADRGTQRRA